MSDLRVEVVALLLRVVGTVVELVPVTGSDKNTHFNLYSNKLLKWFHGNMFKISFLVDLVTLVRNIKKEKQMLNVFVLQTNKHRL